MKLSTFSLSTTGHRFLALGGLAAACLALTACSQGQQVSTHAAGHAITAEIKGNGTTVTGRADGALLGSEFGHVTVERVRMRIEGGDWVNIAEEVPVTVSIGRGHIALKAGKVSVGRTVSE